jgi:hypothetical protein
LGDEAGGTRSEEVGAMTQAIERRLRTPLFRHRAAQSIDAAGVG